MAEPILSRLRSETATAHQSLEDLVQIETCLRTPAKYADLLTRFHGFYAPMETVLEESDARNLDLDLENRRKAVWITEDLEALGQTGQPELVCFALPAVKSTARALGALYVLEGSTLGGRTISGMMQGSAIPENARRFFHGYGSETGPRWKAFCTAVDNYVAAEGHSDEVVAGANDTFSAMENWMRETAR